MSARRVALFVWVGLAASGAAFAQHEPKGFVHTRGRWFIDGYGRVLMLHSINVCNRSKRPPFLPPYSREQIARLRSWGFDSVRYVMVWEAIEPEPGQYDDAFLDQVAERLRWCREAGLRVVLDMHQDIYARKYLGDGAPEWACIDDGLPFKRIGGAWYMNYGAPAVMRAFDRFWANAPGPGGVGVQDRFVAAWQHVARRFRDDPNVIGYDLLNEPYYGTAAYPIFFALAGAMARELGAEVREPLMQLAAQPHGQRAVAVVGKLLVKLHERGAVLRVLDAASGPGMDFERRRLQPFYNQLVAAIREVDPRHICFFEPAGGAASGTRLLTAIDVPRDAQGKPFANVAFAPHHYDLWRDLGLPRVGPSGLATAMMRRGVDAAQRMGAPVWFGEWGGFGSRPAGSTRFVSDMLDAFDESLCGWAWWSYTPNFGKLPFRPMLGRMHAEAIAGAPRRMSTTADAFVLEFSPLPAGGETILWARSETKPRVAVKLSGSGQSKVLHDGNGLIRVHCPPGVKACTITLRRGP